MAIMHSQTKLIPHICRLAIKNFLFLYIIITFIGEWFKIGSSLHVCHMFRYPGSKQQFQSLLGSLLYVTKCIKSARYFLNCMLQVLRSNADSATSVLTDSFYKDLCWFNTFLDQYNGVTYFDNKVSDHTVHLDVSMTRMGVVFGDMVYTLPIPHVYQQLHITLLEMLNVVVTLKVWATFWQDKKFK